MIFGLLNRLYWPSANWNRPFRDFIQQGCTIYRKLIFEEVFFVKFSIFNVVVVLDRAAVCKSFAPKLADLLAFPDLKQAKPRCWLRNNFPP